MTHIIQITFWKNNDLLHQKIILAEDTASDFVEDYNKKNFNKNEKYTSFAEIIDQGLNFEVWRSNGEVTYSYQKQFLNIQPPF